MGTKPDRLTTTIKRPWSRTTLTLSRQPSPVAWFGNGIATERSS
jgi:hypothetical protein